MRSSCKHLVFACLSIVPIGNLRADECTPPSSGPDVIIGGFVGDTSWGTVSGIMGLSIGTMTCNIGNAPLDWNGDTTAHPVLVQNMYRQTQNRFEQIGMSWAKHVNFAVQENDCCVCNPTSFEWLGAGCSDVYDGQTNGNQIHLGPRSEINSSNGTFPMPFSGSGQSGNAIYKRLQVPVADFNATTYPGAIYYKEAQLVSAHDVAFGNALNNASASAYSINPGNTSWHPPSGLVFEFDKQPAIYAWEANDPAVTLVSVDVPGDGRFFVSQKSVDLGGGFWLYEYAIFNMNSHRAARSFSVPMPQGVTISNIGFHDVDYHSGEPYDGTDWPGVRENGAVTWSTDPFDVNPNANALRWGTLYNFRFDADAPPGSTVATMGLFRPGAPDAVTLVIDGPVVVVPTLSAGGLLLMGGVFAAAGWWVLRKAGRHA